MRTQVQHPIDFVIPWVDPHDPQWQSDFKKFTADPISADARFARYRDWGLLKYWFRGVEKYAPWVNKIHFITYGHHPKWLNTDHPKLHIVRHEDYIPAEYLPVFSSHPIELFINRIDGLAEHFVYFNDDFYLTAPVSIADFFVDGLPCDMAIPNVITGQERTMMGVQTNNLSVLNRHFDKRTIYKKHFLKWFNYRYPVSGLIRSLLLSPWPFFSGFLETHFPQPFLKSTLDTIWEKEGDMLHHTAKSRFRSQTDNNQYLFRHWQLCEGNFSPKNVLKHGKYFTSSDDNVDEICSTIVKAGFKFVIVNDGDIDDEVSFNVKVEDAFLYLFSERSDFEK